MTCYKSLLLFWIAILLLIGGASVSADEVSQASNSQTAEIVVPADSQSQPAETVQKENSTVESSQVGLASEQTSQEPAVNQEQTPQSSQAKADASNNQVVNPSTEQTANQNQHSAINVESEADTNTMTDSEGQEGRDSTDISTEEY